MMHEQTTQEEPDEPMWHETGTGWLVTDGRAHIHVENPVQVKR